MRCRLALYVLAPMAVSAVTFGAPRQSVSLAYATRPGDGFEANRTYSVEMDGTTTSDTGECQAIADAYTKRDRFTQVITQVGATVNRYAGSITRSLTLALTWSSNPLQHVVISNSKVQGMGR